MQAPLRLLAAALCFVSLHGCKERVPDQSPVDDPWAEVRASLLEGDRCFANDAAYCPSEPAFVDAVIQGVLDKRFGGTMPTTRDEVDAVKKKVGYPYEKAGEEPEAMAAIEALIRARYEAPVITTEGKRVIADHGHVAGPLRVFRRGGLNMAPSPLADGNQWASAEVGKWLRQLAADHPEAELLELRIRVPSGTSGPQAWTYTYKRSSKRIRVARKRSTSYSVLRSAPNVAVRRFPLQGR